MKGGMNFMAPTLNMFCYIFSGILNRVQTKMRSQQVNPAILTQWRLQLGVRTCPKNLALSKVRLYEHSAQGSWWSESVMKGGMNFMAPTLNMFCYIFRGTLNIFQTKMRSQQVNPGILSQWILHIYMSKQSGTVQSETLQPQRSRLMMIRVCYERRHELHGTNSQLVLLHF